MGDLTDIEEAMIDAVDSLSQSSGSPDSMWHPDFGWVLINGEPTETTEAFYLWLKENGHYPND